MVDYRQFIESDPAYLLGKPRIKGTRISIELILRKLAEGASFAQISSMYPGIGSQEVLAILAYAADVMSGEEA
jgi:uncharacterized protein (DUF433 family)